MSPAKVQDILLAQGFVKYTSTLDDTRKRILLTSDAGLDAHCYNPQYEQG